LPANDRVPFEQQAQEAAAKHQLALKDFQRTPEYKRFARLVAKPKAKPKAKAAETKAKAAEPTASTAASPVGSGPGISKRSKPEKPGNEFTFFLRHLKSKGEALTHDAVAAKWEALAIKERQVFIEKAKMAKACYKEELREWQKATTGTAGVASSPMLMDRNQRASRLTSTAPSRPSTPATAAAPPEAPLQPPKSAKMMFLEERRQQATQAKAVPSGGPRELAMQLLQEWDRLSADQRRVYESREQSLRAAYEGQLKRQEAARTQEIAKAQAAAAAGSGTHDRGGGRGRRQGGRGRGPAAGKRRKVDGGLSMSSSDQMGSTSTSSSSSDSSSSVD